MNVRTNFRREKEMQKTKSFWIEFSNDLKVFKHLNNHQLLTIFFCFVVSSFRPQKVKFGFNFAVERLFDAPAITLYRPKVFALIFAIKLINLAIYRHGSMVKLHAKSVASCHWI